MPESHARGPFPAAAGVRIGWTELPGSVRSGIEGRLGSLVMTAASQPSGFSPGAALRLQLVDGRRAFVKAVGREPNPQSPALHREEARMLAQLPRTAPVPGLLGVHDDGDWVALVLEDVRGQASRAALANRRVETGHGGLRRPPGTAHALPGGGPAHRGRAPSGGLQWVAAPAPGAFAWPRPLSPPPSRPSGRNGVPVA